MKDKFTPSKIGNRAENMKVGIVASRFNEELTDELLRITHETLEEQKVLSIVEIRVPGALEIPIACQKLIDHDSFDVIIALGIVIKGETTHFEHVSTETIHALSNLSLKKDIPIISGIITALTEEQAKERISRGKDFALSAIEIANTLENLTK